MWSGLGAWGDFINSWSGNAIHYVAPVQSARGDMQVTAMKLYMIQPKWNKITKSGVKKKKQESIIGENLSSQIRAGKAIFEVTMRNVEELYLDVPS